MNFIRWNFLFFVSIAANVMAAPPQFIPPKLIDFPKPAAIIQHEVTAELNAKEKNIVIFDVHGIFTREIEPSTDSRVTLNNRFIPTLKIAKSRGAQVFAISAHDQPEILYNELKSLKYTQNDDSVYSDFTSEKAAKESGQLLVPFADGTFRIMEFVKNGNIISAKIPGARYYRAKAVASLISLLNEKEILALTIPPPGYQKVLTTVKDLAEDIAAEVIAGSPGRYFPTKCSVFGVIPGFTQFLLENWYSQNVEEDFLDKLNTYIEKEICAVIKGGKRTYPYGKPSLEQKEALKNGLKGNVEKLISLRKQIEGMINPEAIQQITKSLNERTRGLKVFLIDDSFTNVVAFQKDLLASGYFQDGTVYLEYARGPDKDKELSAKELEKQLETAGKALDLLHNL